MKRSHAFDPAAGFLDKKARFPKSLRTRESWAEYFELKRSEYPHLHQIEPANSCPYSCIMCPHSRMIRKKGLMETDLFKKALDEYAGYPEPVRSMDIELFHFGEPLLHPELAEMVSYASSQNLNTILSVNAPDLTPDKAKAILRAEPRIIYISLDGYDDESYRLIRGGSRSYSDAQNNIESLIKIHSGMNSGVLIILRMIIMNANREHAEAFKTEWEKKGIQVELRQFFPWTENSFADLGAYQKYPPGMPCPFPWQHLVIQYNGDVVPCCRDYDGVNILGNIKQESMKEIWNSSAYAEFREQHAAGDFGENAFCENCTKLYYTEPD